MPGRRRQHSLISPFQVNVQADQHWLSEINAETWISQRRWIQKENVVSVSMAA
jgi:hypothetical protein